jgi:putative MFS transporter
VSSHLVKPDTAEQSPTARRFLRRMTLTTAWGEGLDGYDLGVLSVVLPLLSIELGVSPIWAGLIGASSLIGIFFGAPIVGHLTDRFGRRLLFLIDIAASVVLNILQGVVTEPWQLFVVRLLIGVAIGAEYAIGRRCSPSSRRRAGAAGAWARWWACRPSSGSGGAGS